MGLVWFVRWWLGSWLVCWKSWGMLNGGCLWLRGWLVGVEEDRNTGRCCVSASNQLADISLMATILDACVESPQ